MDTDTTEPQKETKLLKDVLERYMNSQKELCETIVEIFNRIVQLDPAAVHDDKKRKDVS